MARKLENKIVFITGGNSGIGKAAALAAAGEGAIVVIADLAAGKHEQTLTELSVLGAKNLFVPIDVSDVNSVRHAISATGKSGRGDKSQL